MAGELKLIEAERSNGKRVKVLERRLRQEQRLKEDAFRKLEIFREEMHGMDHDQDSIATIWKTRCEEVEVTLRETEDENAILRAKLEELGQTDFLEALSVDVDEDVGDT
jgi:hypothetical protein